MIHLKGDQAAALDQNAAYASVDLKSSNAEKVLTQLLAEHYSLDATKLNIQLEKMGGAKEEIIRKS